MFCVQVFIKNLMKNKHKMATYTNADIINKHRVKAMGGIRKSNETKSFVLIINPDVFKYSDSIQGDYEIIYDGEFVRGHRDQEMKWGNKALAETNWPLHVYSGKRGVYKYLGEYTRRGDYQTTYDADGRRMFVFPLVKTYHFDSFEY